MFVVQKGLDPEKYGTKRRVVDSENDDIYLVYLERFRETPVFVFALYYENDCYLFQADRKDSFENDIHYVEYDIYAPFGEVKIARPSHFDVKSKQIKDAQTLDRVISIAAEAVKVFGNFYSGIDPSRRQTTVTYDGKTI